MVVFGDLAAFGFGGGAGAKMDGWSRPVRYRGPGGWRWSGRVVGRGDGCDF